MNRNNWITQAALGILFCATGSVLGQAHTSANTSAKPLHTSAKPTYNHAMRGLHATPIILTPAEVAALKEQNSLDDAAAASLDAGQYADAEEDARQSIAIGQDSGVAQEVLAAALDAQGKSQEALEVYQQMAFLGGDHARNLLPYALLSLKAGHWTEAVTAYNKALSDLSDGNLVRANSHFSPDVPQPKELETALHIALGLTYSYSATWGKHSQVDKATSEYKKAVALEPDSPLANLYYGRALRRLGRKAEAHAAFAKAASTAQGDVKAAAEEEIKR